MAQSRSIKPWIVLLMCAAVTTAQGDTSYATPLHADTNAILVDRNAYTVALTTANSTIETLKWIVGVLLGVATFIVAVASLAVTYVQSRSKKKISAFEQRLTKSQRRLSSAQREISKTQKELQAAQENVAKTRDELQSMHDLMTSSFTAKTGQIAAKQVADLRSKMEGISQTALRESLNFSRDLKADLQAELAKFAVRLDSLEKSHGQSEQKIHSADPSQSSPESELQDSNQAKETIVLEKMTLDSTGDTPGQDDDIARNFLNTGDKALAEEQYDVAISWYNKAAELFPDLSEAWFKLAYALYYKGSYRESIDAYTTSALFDRDNPIIYNNIGLAHYHLGEYHSAIRAFNQALTLKDDYIKALINRGLAQAALSKYEDALENFNKIATIAPNLVEGWHYKGLAHHSLKDFDSAITAYHNALSLDQDLPGTRDRLASALNSRGATAHNRADYANAINDYTEAIALDPNSSIAFTNRAQALCAQGSYKESIEDLNQAISLSPDDALNYYHRGIANTLSKHYHDSIEDFTRAIDLDPTYVGAYEARAFSKCYLGDHNEAIQDIDECLRLADQPAAQAVYIASRALIFAQRGNIEETIGNIEHALGISRSGTLYNCACAYAVLFRVTNVQEYKSQSLELLQEALSAEETDSGHVAFDPDWDHLRDDSKFREILANAAKNS